MYIWVASNRTQATANQFYVNSGWIILTANKFEWRHIFLIWHPYRRRQTYLCTHYLKCVYLKAMKDFRLVEDHYKQFVYPYYVRQLIYSCLTITNRCCNNILYCTLLLITGQISATFLKIFVENFLFIHQYYCDTFQCNTRTFFSNHLSSLITILINAFSVSSYAEFYTQS